ncbi:MAG: ATP-binding protein, partial [Snowella sp.]
FRVIHPDGSIHFLKCYGVVMRDDQGNPLRIIGVNFEITEQKRAEQTIRQQIQKETLLRQITQHMRETLDLQTIFDTACQEIRQFIHTDRVGIFKFYAESGFDDGEFVAESVKEGLASVLAIKIHDHCFGADYSEHYTKGHFQAVNDVLQSDLPDCHKAILNQFEIRANLVIPLLLGEKLWGLLCIHTCAAPRIWQPDEIDLIQQIAGQLAIAIQQANLFEQLQQEQQKLTQSNQDLVRATRLKDEFLANMSHELRTPLTAILGMSEALRENTFGDINPAQEKAIKLIEKSGDHLLSLINDILDLSKIEAGKLELELASTSVQTLCENSIMFVKQMAFTKNINLQTQIAENIDQIRVDELRIRQSLINLLSNAIKFTPKGGNVLLSVELEETEILFSVTDTGIGISSTDLDKLFQPFIQIDSSLNRQYAGTGLGLVLVERIITKHGGRVSVTSRVGEGSCFTLHLPYVPSSRKIIPAKVETTTVSANETNAPLLVSPLILLADDNEANRQTLDDYLSNKGYRMLLAYNGKEALEVVKTHRPDLVLMDIQMPEMDGLEATTLIRSDPAIADIPIIALTALAFPEQADQCFYAGFNDYLAKPVRFKLLMDTIQKFCQRDEV